MSADKDITAESLAAAAQEDVQQAVAEAAEAHRASSDSDATSSETNSTEQADVPAGNAEGEAAEGATDSADAASGDSEEGAKSDSEQELEDAAMQAYKTRLREFMRSMKKLPGEWYIVQCYSGYENKVKTNLEMRAQTLGWTSTSTKLWFPSRRLPSCVTVSASRSSASYCRATCWFAWN